MNCSQCERSFASMFSLNRHKKSVHATEDDDDDNMSDTEIKNENDEKVSNSIDEKDSDNEEDDDEKDPDNEEEDGDYDDEVKKTTTAWQYVLEKMLKSDAIKSLQISSIDQLWKDHNVTRISVQELQRLTRFYTTLGKVLNMSELMIAITHESKRLEMCGYEDYEADIKAWQNRDSLVKELFEEMLDE
jgi:hypothetical protein